MTKPTSIIELNGKRYDTRTGRLLSEEVVPSRPTSVGGSIDGFIQAPVRPAVCAPSAKSVHHPPVITSHAAAGPQPAMDITRTNVHHLPHHKPQHSTTLMRKAVSKPSPTLKRQLKVASPTTALVPAPHYDIAPKPAVTAVDPYRLRRAHTVSRSELVTRFGVIPSQSRSTPGISRTTTPFVPVQASQPATAVSRPATTAAPAARQAQPSTDIFERALATANSHRQPAVKAKPSRKKGRVRRVVSVAASSLAILLIIGFVAYLNQATLQMHLADSRAGISASLPRWEPNGFTVGNFSYGPNTVTVSFRSATDPSQSFSLTQTASSWDSSALLSDYVLPNTDMYDTIQTQGNTIYTYGNNDATWVSGGIWYKLTTHGALSTNQIAQLAASM